MSLNNLDEIKNQEEFDRLMAAANVYRRRDDYVQATQAVKKALQIYPDNLDAREFATDMIYAHGDVAKAVEHYKSILEADPKRASAETKYAKAILELAEGKRQRELFQEMLEHPSSANKIPQRSIYAALILSGVPGLGQVYCGQFKRGVIFFVTTILSWLLFSAFAPSVDTYLKTTDRIFQFIKDQTPLSILFCCIAMFMSIYALVDAVVLAEKTKPGKAMTEPE